MAWPSIADIRTRVRDALNESTAAFYTDAMLDRWINDAQRDIALKTSCLEHISSTITTVASQKWVYTIATDATPYLTKVLYVEYVPGSGTPIGLWRITPSMVGRVPLSGAAPQFWFPWGDNMIFIEPTPASTYNLLVYAAAAPITSLGTNETGGGGSGETDTPVVPAELVNNLVDGAVWRALLRDGQYAKSLALYTKHNNTLMRVRADILSKYAMGRKMLEIPDRIVEGGK